MCSFVKTLKILLMLCVSLCMIDNNFLHQLPTGLTQFFVVLGVGGIGT